MAGTVHSFEDSLNPVNLSKTQLSPEKGSQKLRAVILKLSHEAIGGDLSALASRCTFYQYLMSGEKGWNVRGFSTRTRNANCAACAASEVNRTM